MDEKPTPRRFVFAVWRWPWWALILAVFTSLLVQYAVAYCLLMTRTFTMVPPGNKVGLYRLVSSGQNQP